VKVQCTRCKEIVVLEFSVKGGGIDVHCPGCDARYFVAGRTPDAPPAPAPQKNETACPKCGEEQPRPEQACRRCGLGVERWTGWSVEAAADASTIPIDQARQATTLWDTVVAKWDEPSVHNAFLAHCQATGSFAFAAARYRAVLGQRPDDTVAPARLAQVRALAERVMTTVPVAARTSKQLAPVARAVAIVGVLFIALIVAYFAFSLDFGGSIARRPPQVRPSAPSSRATPVDPRFQPEKRWGTPTPSP
jgi:hypothetical protein